YARETRAQQRQDLEQLESAWEEAGDHRAQDEARLDELAVRLAEEQPRHSELQSATQAAGERLAGAEQAMQEWQSEWEEFNQRAAEPAQIAQVERTRINHLEAREQELERRIARHTEELGQLDDRTLAAEIADLENAEVARVEQAEVMQERLEEIGGLIGGHRDAIAAHRRHLDQARQTYQAAKGRLASLEALQQAALGKDESGATRWLGEQGLDSAPRLAEGLEVEAGWERAAETALGPYLQAACVNDLSGLRDAVLSAPNVALTLFDAGASATPYAGGDGSLADKVRAPWALHSLLGAVRLAPDLDAALGARESLAPHESIITPEGVWVGPDWMRLGMEADETAGVLERAEQIRALEQEVMALDGRSARLSAELDEHQESLHRAESERDQAQHELDGVNRGLSEVRSALSGKRTRADHLRQRGERVRNELRELDERLEHGRAEMEDARSRLHRALEAMETLSASRDALVQRRESLQAALAEARSEAAETRARAHEAALRIESMLTSEQSLREGLERVRSRLDQMSRRREELVGLVEAGEAPIRIHAEELEQLLVRRVEVESELAGARDELETIDQSLRDLERKRHEAEAQVTETRGELEQLRMERQEVAVREQTIDEQLRESGFERAQLFEGLPEDAASGDWQQSVDRVGQRIQRLGPINLAAIDEFREQSERMTYLDAQDADISASLETLETAIRKIDRETRTRFKETFDRVNHGLQQLFPRLFGGGHAYLQLTGEDLLDTGVAVMARPPGKRNSSIHLLSGGEKALTAVALVFAIFELNPAPFCMLDEVDAPLDDANVGRFCEMVRAMSDRIQFIFITHNKITMEMADQLTGVTMQEPGVSRLVSVDVHEAAQMAAV
ncbi:MAG: chromosome segregation protein SMC, partial [Chromatiales bacterium]